MEELDFKIFLVSDSPSLVQYRCIRSIYNMNIITNVNCNLFDKNNINKFNPNGYQDLEIKEIINSVINIDFIVQFDITYKALDIDCYHCTSKDKNHMKITIEDDKENNSESIKLTNCIFNKIKLTENEIKIIKDLINKTFNQVLKYKTITEDSINLYSNEINNILLEN